ncbi:hypothetical protein R1flu_019850 [Riccia fluitans]|uniref:Uncharacterized protein n=1 Tax=Riccia fluitans TaxID=41844 RepID=A0ABD1ZJT2_9MARC
MRPPNGRGRERRRRIPIKQKKKKDVSFASEELLGQSRYATENQVARDRALEDIPLHSPTPKCKQTAPGPNVSLGDGSRNAKHA